jgi:hypothetical protein
MGGDEKARASFSEALNVVLKEWLAANAPASLKEAEVEALMYTVVHGLVLAAANFSQNMPGPVRLNGHQFEKLARVAFKEAAKAPRG